MTILAYWSIAWIIGIWLSSLLAVPLYIWVGTALVAMLVAVLTRAYPQWLIFSCVFALALGGARLLLAQPHFDESSLARYNSTGTVTLVGVVAAEPDVRGEFVFYKLDAKTLRLAESGETVDVHGAARVRGPRYPVYEYGDRLQVQGSLEKPPILEPYNYRDYLAHKGIHSQIYSTKITHQSSGDGPSWKRAMLSLKARAQATIGRMLPEPEASLLIGILLGAEGGIPAAVKADFKTTGATHVIAISGFNISIVVALLMATAGWILADRRLAASFALVGVVAYTLLVGADAAVVRAAVMGIVVVIGVLVGRQGVPHNTLAFAVIFMTALNPYFLWDVGFQLSVVATLGLIVYGPRFEGLAQRVFEPQLGLDRAKQVAGWFSAMLLLTVAAQILTTPLILKHFGQLSLVTLLTNALILPVQPLVMAFGGVATLVGLAFEPLGQLLGWWAYLPLTWTIRIVEWTAGFPYASVPLKLSDQGLVAMYGVITALTVLVLLSAERRRELWESMNSSLPRTLALGGMVATALVAWFAVLQLPNDDKLRVTFLDVGQGDAIFIETPKGAQILVDGGPEGDILLSELGRHMPFWDRTLDLVVLTHPDADHLTGLVAALERYDVQAVMACEPFPQSDVARVWQGALAKEGAERMRGETGARIELSDGATLEILHPGAELIAGDEENTNNQSVVIRLVHKDVAFLLPGDIEVDVEKELVRSGAYLRSTVLKVPHHGSDTSSCQDFLDAVRPQVAVISVGADNEHGLPAKAAVERLEGRSLVYRTDENGSVSIASDGRRLWIETAR